MSRKFYRNIVQIVVLSEDVPLEEGLGGFATLENIHDMITFGDCVGGNLTISSQEITGQQAADECYELASEPYFFQLNDDGTDAESY